MRGVFCICIGIIFLLILWKWFTPLCKRIWGKYSERFTVINIEDPVFLFRLLFDVAEYNSNPQLNHNVPYKDSIILIEDRQAFLDKITGEGVTFSSRIVQIQTSAVLPINHASGLKTTGLTTIVCDQDHYCLPGSTITISGIEELNGTYKNGVSLISYSNEKRDIANRVDASYDNDDIKGSALGFLHSFQLIKDTSSMPSSSSGIYKGYVEHIPSSARVEVMHKVYKNMNYNEWLASVLTCMCYLYGPNDKSYIHGYASDIYGRVVEDWSSLSLNSIYMLRCHTRNGTKIEPMQGFVINTDSRYDNNSAQINKIYSIMKRFWINDPYHIDNVFTSHFQSYIINDYDLIGTPDTFGPLYSINIIPCLNYLKPKSIKNLYWGLTGSGSKTIEQDEICRILNLFNVDTPSILGGTELVGQLFDWVNPYDYEEVKKGRMYPNPQTWVLLGSTNTEDGRDRKSRYLNLYCGILQPELTTNRIIGYIYISNFLFVNKIANGSAHYFSGDLPKGFETYNTNLFIRAQYSIMKILSPMMKYLVTDQQCESIIIDIRGNYGGEYRECLASFFGDIRYGINTVRVHNDTGYSFPLHISGHGLQEAFDKIWVDLASTFEGCVFKGNNDQTKKVVILNSYGSKTRLFNCFIGDNGDNYLGSNTYASLIGSNTVGTIAGSYLGSLNISTMSSRLKISLEYSFTTGDISIYSVPHGPLFNKPTYSNGYWNQVYGTADVPNSLKGLAGGSSLRNDIGLLYYSLGIITCPDDLFIKHLKYQNPEPTNPLSWKDPWLEQSIREALSVISKIELSSIYSTFEWDTSGSSNIIDSSSFIIESGQTLVTKNSWNLVEFNLQINFILDRGVIQFDPRGADDRGNTLVPFGDKSENLFIGYVSKDSRPLYGVLISSELYTTGIYAIGFFVGNMIKQFNSKLSFPSAISILIQENDQIYFTVNGFHMYQGNVTFTDDSDVKIGAILSHNIKDKKSVVVVKDFVFQ
jgi:hypothetical protein